MSKLFEYAVLFHPKATKKGENEQKGKSLVLVDVTRVVAASDREVGIVASRQIPTEYDDKLEQVEIVIRPF